MGDAAVGRPGGSHCKPPFAGCRDVHAAGKTEKASNNEKLGFGSFCFGAAAVVVELEGRWK